MYKNNTTLDSENSNLTTLYGHLRQQRLSTSLLKTCFKGRITFLNFLQSVYY